MTSIPKYEPRAHLSSARGVARPYSSLKGRATVNSCMLQDSGVSAELRHAHKTQEFEHTVLRYSKASASSPRHLPRAGGTPLKVIGAEILDGLCTIVGLLTLCCLAVFLLALA